MKNLFLLTLLSISSLTYAAPFKDNATCTIFQEGVEYYNGPCQFKADKKGWSISAEEVFVGELQRLTFTYIKPGVAHVTGYDMNGYKSDWGILTRKGACWSDKEIKICAKGK